MPTVIPINCPACCSECSSSFPDAIFSIQGASICPCLAYGLPFSNASLSTADTGFNGYSETVAPLRAGLGATYSVSRFRHNDDPDDTTGMLNLLTTTIYNNGGPPWCVGPASNNFLSVSMDEFLDSVLTLSCNAADEPFPMGYSIGGSQYSKSNADGFTAGGDGGLWNGTDVVIGELNNDYVACGHNVRATGGTFRWSAVLPGI